MIIYLVITLFTVIFFVIGFKFFIFNNGTVNQVYLKTLNISMPVMKVTADEYIEHNANYYSDFMNLLSGLTSDPVKIIKREVAYFKDLKSPAENVSNSNNTNIPDFTLMPYDLNNSSVDKIQPADVQNSNINNVGNSQSVTEEFKDLPNKTVQVYDSLYKKTLNKTKPEVLIYHTHTHEAYIGVNAAVTDKDLTVQAVGSELSKELENNYGVSVLHDTTIHDLPSYFTAYKASGTTLTKYLKEYGSFKLIIDLHRDSSESRKDAIVKLNNENVAKMMFVASKGNPNFNKNEAIIKKLVETSNKLFPGLCKPSLYYNNKTNHFNAEKSTSAVLIEVGTDKNTIEDAKATTKYLARVIAQYVNAKN
jgi:stage II sporulation protein P